MRPDSSDGTPTGEGEQSSHETPYQSRARGGEEASDGAPSTSSRPTEGERSRLRDAVVIAVVGAVVTAFATALATGALGFLTGDNEASDDAQEPTSTQKSSAEDLSLESASSKDGAITVQKPGSWGHGDSGWDQPFDDLLDPGTGLVAGTTLGLTNNDAFDSERLYVAASSAAASRLKTAGRPEGELLDYVQLLNRQLDWTLEGCSLVDEGTLDKPGFVSSYRRWGGCAGFDDMRFVEFQAMPEDGRFLVQGQSYTSALGVEQQMELVRAWSVREEALPEGDPQATELPSGPLPPWL